MGFVQVRKLQHMSVTKREVTGHKEIKIYENKTDYFNRVYNSKIVAVLFRNNTGRIPFEQLGDPQT